MPSSALFLKCAYCTSSFTKDWVKLNLDGNKTGSNNFDFNDKWDKLVLDKSAGIFWSPGNSFL